MNLILPVSVYRSITDSYDAIYAGRLSFVGSPLLLKHLEIFIIQGRQLDRFDERHNDVYFKPVMIKNHDY